MAKQACSFRIEEEQLEQLNKLVEYYKLNNANNDFPSRISKAEVIQFLIKKQYRELQFEQKI